MRKDARICVQITGVNMASQEDDNKLESKSNVNKDQERNFINVYKKFEYILNSKIEPFPKKIQSLIEIWKSVGQYNQQNSDIRYMVQIMDWAKLHTLNIVLTGKWKMFKGEFEASLLAEVEKTQSELMKLNDIFSMRCQKLADVIKNPWDDPILSSLLRDNAAIGPKEIEFFCVETAYLVSVRLKKLCESQCEDLALNLVTAFMNCYHLSLTQNFNLNATKTQILFCFDIHVALLYRYNKMSEIVALFKKLSLEEGLHLIRRFARKRIKISKVWRNYPEITFLASQVFVTAAVTKPCEESGDILKDLLDIWISFSLENSMVEKLESSIRRIIHAANAAEHIYICSEILYDKVGLKIKTFAVELYIRALTTDMNNLESQKTENDNEKVEKTTKRLANGFFNLAEILKDKVQVSRECALTGFSLEPTLERLQKIEDLARASGFNVLDTGQIWECKLHPPVSSSDDVSWVCNSCGKWMCKPNLDLRLTTNFALNEALNFETLEIHPQLCDDLAVVLNGPRYHLLSWLLRWEDLHRLCEMYLNDMERTKNLVTELKFVDIDYSMFASIKREPVDELAGIEKGYEQFLYSDFNEKLGIMDGAPSSPPELPQPKSDPNTLKSLRMFRHNLKKNRPQCSSESNNSPNSSQNYSPGLLSPHGLGHLSREIMLNQQRFLEYNNPQEYIQNVKLLNEEIARKCNYLLDNNLSEDLYSDSSRDYNRGIVDVAHDMSSSNSSLSENFSEVRDFRRRPGDGVYSGAMYPNPMAAFVNSSGNYLHDLVQQELLRSQSEENRGDNSDFLSKMDHLVSPSRWANPENRNNYSPKSYHKYGAVRAYPPYSPSSRPQNRKQQTKTSFLPHTYRGPPQNSNWHQSDRRSDSGSDLLGEDDEVPSEEFLALQRELDYSNKVIQELLADPAEKNDPETSVQNENSSKNANCLPDNEPSSNSKDDKNVVNQKSAIITTNNHSSNNTGLMLRKLEDLQSNEKFRVENPLPIDRLSGPANQTTQANPPMTLEEIENIVGFDRQEFFRQQASLPIDIKNSYATSSPEKARSAQNGGEVEKATREEAGKNVRREVSKLLRAALEKKAKRMAREIEDNAPTLENKAKRLKEMEEIKGKQDNNLLLRTLSEHHIPIIVDKSADASGKPKRDFDKRSRAKFKEAEFSWSDSDEASEDIFDDDVPKPNTYKELKIILYRLTTDMIKSFIPSYTGSSRSDRCECDRRTVGRPRKYCTCEHRNPNMLQKPLPQNRGFDKIGYNKRKDDRHKRSPTNRNGDTHKKTGPRKYGDGHLKGDDSARKPKRDSDKTFTSRSGHFDENLIRTTMNPRVVLERLPLDTNYVRSVLSNVPGLNDYEMIRPGNVNHIVNVVQISGGRSASNVPVQNTQTSTQITPHIQRIGQPRSDKPEHNANSETPISSVATPTSTSNTIKPSTSQPSTLINILSQQIIRPGQSNCVRSRSSPLINILSQQIIRPATTQPTSKAATNSVQSTDVQAVTTPKIVSSVEQSSTNEATAVKTVTTTTKGGANPPAGGQGTILQFICKSTLPKFQQAFGKSVYQNNTETTDATSTCTETASTTSEVNKKSPTKTSPVNIQPIQGGVIYTRQMPVGQTINLIPPGRGQVFRIATSNSDQISLVKDTVIHSKMSALLAAALQGKQKSSETQSDGEGSEEAASTRLTVTRPTLVQNARIVKPVLQIPSNVIRTSPQSNLSSTTLEQLREFDMVYKQIKERSSTSTPSESNTPSDSSETTQRISVTYLNQGQKYTQLSPVVVVSSYCNLQPAASPALSVTSQGSSSPCVTPAPTPSVPKISSKGSKGKTVKSTTTQASKASPIPKPQQKPQEDEHTTQRIFDILAEYAEQLRNSPDLNNKPAPRRRSNPPTNPSQNSKRKKSSSSKKSGQCSSMVSEADIEDHRTVGSEDSSCGVVQISVQEEEQQHGQIVTTESNDSSSGSRQQLILTDAGNNQTRNLIIADPSVGEALKMPNTAVLVPGNYIMPVSMVKGGQQIAVVSGGSKILATVPARSGPNMLLFQSFLNQNRKSGVPTVKYSTIQPISGISSQSLAGVSGQPPVILPTNSHNLTAVTLGQPITLKKIDEADNVNTELLLTISQPRDNVNSTTEPPLHHPDSSSNAITSTVGNIELEETIIHSDNSSEKVYHTFQKSIITAPIATPVIAQASCVKETTNEEHNSTPNSITLNVSENNKSEGKSLERVQSVLVTACTSNGPMLSHTPPRYRKASDSTGVNNDSSNKEEFLHNGEKQNNNEQKHFQGNAAYFQKNKKTQNPQRLDRELHQLCLQRKQAALERELRLQKSLSEECEDLGVDEPSTSDLFPEADILFDSNHSPSFDQTSQDLVKRVPQDIKEENKSMTLFSDDDNSSSLRTDFLFESVKYQTTEGELEYVQNQQLTNGQSSVSNESGSSCEDNTLLQNCASMSDVTLNSPVSPDPYNDNMPSTLNKYKFKYSNRRKSERNKQSETWTAEVSSSEDTTGSTELGKSLSHSPESCTNKRSHSISCDDELSDGSYKVVRVAISKSDLLKDEESCEELHCEDDLDCSPSGRGARRSVKKLCSCCNGSQEGGASRKRPSSRPHTPAPHKKAFLNKKR